MNFHYAVKRNLTQKSVFYLLESVASVSARTGGGNFSAEWLSFYEANQKNLGHGDKADFFQLKGTIHIVKSTNAVYKACASADCNKKVIDLDNGMYQCEKCNISSSSFKYRMMLNVSNRKSLFQIVKLINKFNLNFFLMNR